MAFFPAIAGNAEAFTNMLANYPEEFLAFFGMNTSLPIMSVLGFFGLTYSFILVPVAIQASNYGFHMLSVEERELTADFLLSKPVSRSKILISKFSAAVVSLIIVNISIWIASIVALTLFKGDELVVLNNVYILLSSLIVFQFFFVCVLMFISVLLKKISSVLSFSMAFGFGMYILSSLGSLFSSNFFKYLSPYSQFDYGKILVEGKYDIVATSISVLVIVLSLTASYFLYLKRNIHSL